jgi:hypothetical protein
MCAACVAQGVTYVGGAVGALQVMRARARHRLAQRGSSAESADDLDAPEPAGTAPTA